MDGRTRQSGPEAKTAPKDPLHSTKPGGPIMTPQMGPDNPGPTKNLRGVEPNTARHKGMPNEPQHGTWKGKEDHNPGMNDDTHGHGVPEAPRVMGRHSDVSKKQPTPMPGDVAR